MNTRYWLLLLPLLISSFAQRSDESIVRDAMKQAIVNLSQQTPPTTSILIDSQRANSASIAIQRRGDILQETTRLIVQNHGTQILPRLASLDIDRILRSIIG